MTEEDKNKLFEYMREDFKEDMTEIKANVKEIKDEQIEANKKFALTTELDKVKEDLKDKASNTFQYWSIGLLVALFIGKSFL